MRNPFFTIGHSTRPIDEFVDLLCDASVRLVVDVRAIPRSRRVPQFNVDALPIVLTQFGIGYERIGELGGLRGRSRVVPPGLLPTTCSWPAIRSSTSSVVAALSR